MWEWVHMTRNFIHEQMKLLLLNVIIYLLIRNIIISLFKFYKKENDYKAYDSPCVTISILKLKTKDLNVIFKSVLKGIFFF